MAWVRYSRATINSQNPRPLATCDRCGFLWNHDRLEFQFDWCGPRLQNLGLLVCPTCLDTPQQNGQRTIIIPPDPVPIPNARPDPYMFMGQSSSPDPYQSGSPNTIATQGNDPLVTQSSSQFLITQIGPEEETEAPSITAVGGTVSGGAPLIMRSINSGASWEQITPPSEAGKFLSIVYSSGFVAVGTTFDGDGGNPIIATSPDGINWTERTGNPSTDAVLYGITAGLSAFVAVGTNYAFSPARNIVMSSSDGETWADISPPPIDGGGGNLRDVVYGNGLYVACGLSPGLATGIIITSADGGLTWTRRSVASLFQSSALLTVAYNGSIFVAGGWMLFSVPQTQPVIATSSDGITWTAFTVPTIGPVSGGKINSITWTGSQWVAVGVGFSISDTESDPIIATSPDGLTWTQRVSIPSTNAVFYGVSSSGLDGGLIVAVGKTIDTNEPIVNESADGIEWTRVTPVPTTDAAYHDVVILTPESA